ncbi:MAG: carboxymuconolactone decarboxylase family protein [Rhodospirillales bacterium]
MQRISRIEEATASEKTTVLLTAVRRQMGGVPNIIATMARSSAALAGYLELSGALAGGCFSAAEREQIALAVAGANGCDYCASAHTAVGGMTGLKPGELSLNLTGQSENSRVAAVLRFVTRIVTTRGRVSDDDLQMARKSGLSEEEIVETIALTVLNIFTNYLNHIADTDIDFPLVRTDDAAAA